MDQNTLKGQVILHEIYQNFLWKWNFESKGDSTEPQGWSDGAKVSCILCYRGVQLILAYRWARSAIHVAGKGRGGLFLFLLFLPFHSCSSFFPVPHFHLFYYLFYLFSPFLWETTQNDDTKWPTRVDVSLNPNTINQSIEPLSPSESAPEAHRAQ